MRLKRILFDKISAVWMITALCVVLVIPLAIGGGLYYKSLPLLEHQNFWQLISSSEWLPSQGKFGFLSFILGSLYVTLIAIVLTAPICLLSGIYLTQFSSKKLMKIMHPVIDILAGLPSVIYGIWGVLVVVPFISKYLAPFFNTTSTGYSVFAGGVVLAVMCVPYILNMLIDVFNTVPMGLKEASLSLGATHWESIKHVVIKRSYPGILSAFGLGVAKAFGETMAVMMVVGNMVQSNFSPFKAGYPLPALIANNYGEMLSVPLYDSALMFAALLLFVIILFINIVFRYFIYKTRIQ